MKYNVMINSELQEILGGNPPLLVTVSEDGHSFKTEGLISSGNGVIEMSPSCTLEQKIAGLIVAFAASPDLNLEERFVQERIALVPIL